MTLSEIENLICKLDLKVNYGSKLNNHVLTLRSKHDSSIVECTGMSGNKFCLFSSHVTLAHYLFYYVTCFHVESKSFKNPFLGCKSYEEACIKTDLLVK